MEEFVAFKSEGRGVRVTFGCAYPHELCFFFKSGGIKKLCAFFTAVGRGKSRKRVRVKSESGGLAAPFSVTAKRETGKGPPVLYFEYSYPNEVFGSVSESRIRYDRFGEEDLDRFGRELSEFESTGHALLCEKRKDSIL